MPTLKKTGDRPVGRRAPLAAVLAGLVAALAARPALALEVEFYAVADKEQMGLEDTLTVTVTVSAETGEGDEEDLRLPEAPDFQIISRSQSQQMSFAMGQGGPPSFRRVRVFTLLMVPRRTGTLTIGPGRLVHRGRTWQTSPIKVKVVRAPASRPRAQPTPPPTPPPRAQNPFGLPPSPFLPDLDDPDALLEQFFGSQKPASDTDLYIRNYLDKKQAYLGEQVTLSTYLFARVEVSGVDGFQMPKLDGFWAEDIESPSKITGELKMIDGVPYRVFLLRRRALFPIKSGKLTIDPVKVDISTGFGLVFSGRKVHRTSQALTLEVLPLPPGAPPDFDSSNVGQWRLSAEAAPTTVQLGQPVTLKVTLEGRGNLRSVALPKLPPLRGMKGYDPTSTEKVSISRGRFGGRRVLEYLLMPEQTGDLEIPALTFTYFDPKSGQYETEATAPIAIRVEAGPGGAPRVATGAPALAETDRAVNLIGASGLHPVRYKGALARPAPPVWRRGWFLPVAAAPFGLWLGLLAVGLVRSALAPDPGARRRGAGSRARRRLRKAEHLLKARKADAFYAEVSRVLNDYLSERLETPVAGLTRPDLGARLAAAGLPGAVFERLAALLDACDLGRFAPGASHPSAMQQLHAEALAVMGELEAARLSAPRSEEAAP